MAARTMAMRLPARSAAFARVAVPARSIATTSKAAVATSVFGGSSSAVARKQVQSMVMPALAQQTRGYAASAGLSTQEIQNRIVEVLRSFEKVDPSKISPSSVFTSDLGLDSLDAVEVVMAIEEEFSIEIPDAEADAITSVQQAIDYVAKTPSGE